MARRLKTRGLDDRYVAGLWSVRLESHLTWYVEPMFNRNTREFSHQTVAPRDDCAPSFSWANIDIGNHTLTYNDHESYQPLANIDEIVVEPRFPNSPHSLVHKAKISLWCKLRAIELHSRGKGRYGARWAVRYGEHEPNCSSYDRPEFVELCNVYLDCPSCDEELIRAHPTAF